MSSPYSKIKYEIKLSGATNGFFYTDKFVWRKVLQFKQLKCIYIQVKRYANTNQKPILDKIELKLNSKINEWINVRNTINRYLQSVEHQVKWKKRFKSKLMLSCFMILAWYATICSNWITISWFCSLFYYNLTQRYERGNHWSWLSLRMSWANLV